MKNLNYLPKQYNKNKKLLLDIASVLAIGGVLLNIFLFIRSISIFKSSNTFVSINAVIPSPIIQIFSAIFKKLILTVKIK